MTTKRLRILTVSWWILTIALLPLILWYSGSMLFFYAMSGYGGGENNVLYLLLSLIPPLVLGGGFYKLHAWKEELRAKASHIYHQTRDT